jgi:CxxH/CxxC protein (TIGR04129 family)
MAFDDFLVLNETFPYMEECKDENCDYCGGEAKYKLYPPAGKDFGKDH